MSAKKPRKFPWGNESPAARARELEPGIEMERDALSAKIAEGVRLGLLSIGLDVGKVTDRRGALEPLAATFAKRAEVLGYEDNAAAMEAGEKLEKLSQSAALLGLDLSSVDLSKDSERALFEQFVLGVIAARGQTSGWSAGAKFLELAREMKLPEDVIQAGLAGLATARSGGGDGEK